MVKASDSKSDSLWERGFESRRLRDVWILLQCLIDPCGQGVDSKPDSLWECGFESRRPSTMHCLNLASVFDRPVWLRRRLKTSFPLGVRVRVPSSVDYALFESCFKVLFVLVTRVSHSCTWRWVVAGMVDRWGPFCTTFINTETNSKREEDTKIRGLPKSQASTAAPNALQVELRHRHILQWVIMKRFPLRERGN